VDPSQIIGSSELATKLILELAGGKAEKETVIFNANQDSLPSISLDADKCRAVLGHNLKNQEMFEILEKLRLRKAADRNNISDWEIPSYRRDLTRPADLHEEIA
jgi:phenylalanyl-tRNA synthetase beta subunit